jgi:hypothetical protein
MSAGCQETIVRVPTPGGAYDASRVDAVLRDKGGLPLARLLGVRLSSVSLGRFGADGSTPDLTVIPDGRPDVPGECSLSAGAAPDPADAPASKAVLVRYRIGKGERFFRTEIVRDRQRALPGRPRSYGVWVYGDDSDNFARMRFIDAAGQEFQAKGERITGRGWRYMSFPFEAAQTTMVAGGTDGAIHYPVRIVAPLVMWNGYGHAVAGEIAFACPTVVY